MPTFVAEWGHASYTCSPPQAHSRTLRAGQEHAGDRAVFGLLRGGGAPGAPTVRAARDAPAPDPLMWTPHAADRGAQGAPAKTAVRAAGRHPGRVGCPHGPPLPDFHDGFVASAVGLEV